MSEQKKNIEIDPRSHIALVGSNDIAVREISGYCKSLGLNNINIYSSSYDFLEYLPIQNFSIVFIFVEVKDIHWTNLLRKIRTDENIPFFSICLVLQQGVPLAREWQTFIKDYQVGSLIKPPFSIKDIAKNIAYFAKIEQSPESMEARLKYARQMFQEGLREQAKNLYRDILKSDQNNMSAHSGMIQLSRDDHKDFKKLLNQALKIDPENFSIKFEMLSHYLKTNKANLFDQYVNDLMGELKEDRSTFWLGELGEVCLQLGKNDYGEMIGRHIMKKNNKSDWRQYSFLARCQLQDQRLEEAKINVTRAIHTCPEERGDLHNLYGIIMRRTGNIDVACKAFEKSVENTPEDHRLYFNLAMTYRDLKKVDEAIRVLENALKIAPEYQKARDLLEKLKTI